MTGAVRIVKYVFMLSGIISYTPICNQENSEPGPRTVQLRIIEIGCSARSRGEISSDTSIVLVREGFEFGYTGAPYYFRLLEITDSNSIKVLFTDDLVIVGEPVNHPSERNPVTISDEEQCFRLRHPETGYDYCVEILNTRFGN